MISVNREQKYIILYINYTAEPAHNVGTSATQIVLICGLTL